VSVGWTTALLDTPEDRAEVAERFWLGVTGTRLSPRRGSREEFATLLPERGDPYLTMQRVVRPVPGSLHLDLHTDDVPSLAARARALGAATAHDERRWLRCASPGGFPFCLVAHPARHRPPPQPWPGGASIVDQVCLDIPPGVYDAECAFWADLSGWEHTTGDVQDEFTRLVRPEGMPLAFLLQRLDDEAPAVSAHLDLAADDREAEIARHERLAARVVRRTEGWTVMEDPTGRRYCITGRRPGDV
jgi:hypothetical protein